MDHIDSQVMKFHLEIARRHLKTARKRRKAYLDTGLSYHKLFLFDSIEYAQEQVELAENYLKEVIKVEGIRPERSVPAKTASES